MKEYIIRRLLLILPAAFVTVTVVFFLMNIASGDVVIAMLGQGGWVGTPKQMQLLRTELGLDQPVLQQYADFLWQLVHLDFGRSLWTGVPVIEEIRLRFPATLSLILLSMAMSTAVCIPLGVISAVRQNSALDYLVRIFALAGLSIPAWVSSVLLILFLVWSFQWSTPLGYATLFHSPLTALRQLLLPAALLSFRMMGVGARMMRSCMLEITQADYIRTARAKGLTERVVIWGHALRNAILPVITTLSLDIITLLSGAVIVEYLFNIPGIGSFLATALNRRDLTVIRGVMVVILIFVMLLNLAVDIIYAWVDPRIRYK